MKKSIFTFALFSLVVLTSFTTAPTGDDTGDDDTGTPTTTSTANRTDSGTPNQMLDKPNKKDIVADPLPVRPNYRSEEIDTRRKSDF